jgi:hypothetical protein
MVRTQVGIKTVHSFFKVRLSYCIEINFLTTTHSVEEMLNRLEDTGVVLKRKMLPRNVPPLADSN